jgi:hypothetical protein
LLGELTFGWEAGPVWQITALNGATQGGGQTLVERASSSGPVRQDARDVDNLLVQSILFRLAMDDGASMLDNRSKRANTPVLLWLIACPLDWIGLLKGAL